jgi:hypothetical protein
MTPANARFQMDVEAARDLLGDPETRGSTIYTILLAAYGPEVLHGDPDRDIEPLDPVVLYNQIETDFRTTFPVENENRLQAVLLAIETDAFYEDPEVFTAVCLSLGDGDLGDMVAGAMEDITGAEALWGALEVGLLRENEPDFAPAVSAVMEDSLDYERDDGEGPGLMEELWSLAGDLRDEMAVLGVPPAALAELDGRLARLG